MSGMRKRLQGVLHVLEDLPVEVTRCEHTKACHFKVHLEHAGTKKFFICAGSPSDHRYLKNFKSEVSKWIREVDTHHGDTDAH